MVKRVSRSAKTGLGRAYQASPGSGALNRQHSVGPVKRSLVMASSPRMNSVDMTPQKAARTVRGQGNFGFETPSNKPLCQPVQPQRDVARRKNEASGEEQW